MTSKEQNPNSVRSARRTHHIEKRQRDPEPALSGVLTGSGAAAPQFFPSGGRHSRCGGGHGRLGRQSGFISICCLERIWRPFAFYGIYLVCGRQKPWWLILSATGMTIILAALMVIAYIVAHALMVSIFGQPDAAIPDAEASLTIFQQLTGFVSSFIGEVLNAACRRVAEVHSNIRSRFSLSGFFLHRCGRARRLRILWTESSSAQPQGWALRCLKRWVCMYRAFRKASET